jgi:hypothetical protein
MAIATKLLSPRSVLSRARRLLARRLSRVPESLDLPRPKFAHLYASPGRPPIGPDGSPWLTSCLCTERHFHTPEFKGWWARLGEAPYMHRKLWEIYYISQALAERGLLRPGRRGLGFAVGQEHLPALFAAHGCEIVASDLNPDDPRAAAWAQTNQHASNLAGLNSRGLCDPTQFARLATFRVVDMNRIPDDLRSFDFTWSTCSFEHVGSIELGLRFIHEQLKCLNPGGIAVHTTEFNLFSNTETIRTGQCVLFRRCDIEALVRDLTDVGHYVEPLDLDLGDGPLDRHIDIPPYCHDRHLKLQTGRYVTTSIGLIIRKGGTADCGTRRA